jgi:hypothetical protein
LNPAARRRRRAFAAQSAGGKGVVELTRTIYRPGDIVPVSGQYAVVNSSGQYAGREVTCVRGEPFPPTRTPAEYGYVLRDATIHR